MFVCKICGSEVKQGQAICQGCGADVVDNHQTICSVCGSANIAGSRYCAKCGGILPVMRKPMCIVCGSKNMPGAKYCIACGAPIAIHSETHSAKEMIAARNIKQRLDNMVRDRMSAIEKEIAEKRARAADEIEAAKKEVKILEAKYNEDYNNKVETLENYKKMLNELGAEDVAMLRKLSAALKDYSKYYADPYSQIDEDEIGTDTYVCPACGTINPLNCTCCTNCGRNKARALLLLAKDKIKQSPPVKRKVRVIDPPKEDLRWSALPTLEEFTKGIDRREQTNEAQKQESHEAEVKSDAPEMPSDFSGRGVPYGAYPQYRYPYAQYPQGGFYPEDPNRQMPPIVQPVAFVPYVTQDQPLVQYTQGGAVETVSVEKYVESYVEENESRTSRGKKRK